MPCADTMRCDPLNGGVHTVMASMGSMVDAIKSSCRQKAQDSECDNNALKRSQEFFGLAGK